MRLEYVGGPYVLARPDADEASLPHETIYIRSMAAIQKETGRQYRRISFARVNLKGLLFELTPPGPGKVE